MDRHSTLREPRADHQALASLLRQRRLALGLSQQELAQRLGSWWRTVDVVALECARILIPHWTTLHALAEALNLPIDVLLQAACPACFDGEDSAVPKIAQMLA